MAASTRAQRRSRARAVALPRGGGGAAAHVLRRLAPSRRSVLAGCALLVAAGGLYAGARETSAFAVRRITVTGAPPAVAAQVRRVLAPAVGSSLVALDGAALERRVDELPTVVATGYDRAFPHTLHVSVVPERPAALVRSGRSAWVVSARARIVARVSRDAAPALPRIWLPASATLVAGAYLPRDRGGSAAEAVALAAGFPARIRSVSFAGGSLVFHLASGLELRLGDPADVRLKLAVARRALRVLPPGTTYLDVSVPGRPVAGAGGQPASTVDSQVSGGA